MPVNVTITAEPLTYDCFASEQERLTAYADAMEGQFPSDFTGVHDGQNAPTGTETLWADRGADDKPTRLYSLVSGDWLSKHPLSPGIIAMWAGDAASVTTLDLDAGYTSQGAEAVDATHGPFWEIVSAMAAKFPIGVGTTANGTTVAVTGTGGEDEHTLTTAELPAHAHEVPGIGGNGVDNHGPYYEDCAGPANTEVSGYDTEDTGDGDAHNNLPPYYGVYFIRRTARTHYRI